MPLHNSGKIGVPDTILQKSGQLTEEEWAVMYSHPEPGRQVLVQAGGIFMLLSRIVVAHHESWDGSGYPYGLAQEANPHSARIVAVVDAYDAMTSQRPYREAFPDAEWAELVPLMRELCFAALKNEIAEPIEDKKDAHYR